MSVGANAEYVCLPEAWDGGVLAIKPANMSYEEAAAVPVGGMTALYLLKPANIQRGQTVLIYGASGAVGTNAVQLARHHFGAAVTGVCSAANTRMVQSLGADLVIDYTLGDVTRNWRRGRTGQEGYDVIFDAVSKLSREQRDRARMLAGVFIDVHSDSNGGEKMEDLLTIKDLIEAGKLRPVIDRCYPLEEIVEAHRYVDRGHKRGNVVITVTP